MGVMLIQDMPSLPSSSQPDPAEQAEFQRQFKMLINEHKSYTSIVTWVRLYDPEFPHFILTSSQDYLQRRLGSAHTAAMARAGTHATG